MNRNQEPEAEENLLRTLREWRVDAPLPPRFQEGVWDRISRGERAPGRGFPAGLVRLIEVVLPRPKVAFAYLATFVILGMMAGSVTARIETRHEDAALSARYVQWVSPFQAHVAPR